MPHTYLCFVWHMHQPFYKDLATNEYQLPWTRLHALKDYYGMVKILERYPRVRQTFNLVPSMLVQIEDYASEQAQDPFLRCALKPAEELSPAEQDFILRYFFQANHARQIGRYPRYAELHNVKAGAGGNLERARRAFTPGALRDLQVLSQLAWFDEEFVEGDVEVRGLVARGRHYSLEDQQLVGRKQLEILRQVTPVYRDFAGSGQIELSITPFYHPILPLLCDSNIAAVSNPHAPLPHRFRYPGDAEHQIETAREYAREHLGAAPAGMWPSEGSVSDDVLGIAARAGFRWMATDNGVLGATLGRLAGVEETCRPYVWRQQGQEMRLLFRDHFLSDLIGFVYSRMDAREAANHFLDRVRDNSRHLHAQGRDALVPVILDGENAWEHFDRNGRPFLGALYERISREDWVSAVTVSEALEKLEAAPLERIFPGSWINANFNIWIGAEEDNRAWEYLLRARRTYDRIVKGPEGAALGEERRKLAYEELLIAEGSDWCWWYGPDHHSDNRPEFDKLVRDHLAQVYRALGLQPPEELSRPILRVHVAAAHDPPTDVIQPRIDGRISSYFEWLGAGLYAPDLRQGAMHGREALVERLCYGSDGDTLYLRVDFSPKAKGVEGVEVQLKLSCVGQESTLHVALGADGASLVSAALAGRSETGAVRCAYEKVLEIAILLPAIQGSAGDHVAVQASFWREGLPVDAVPHQGWLDIVAVDPGEWAM
jgi:alpha-amylase/alpha-mannosidase (GH57 family)